MPSSGETGSFFIFLMAEAGMSSLASSSSATDSEALRLPLVDGVLVPALALAGARLRGVFGVVAAFGMAGPATAPSPPSFLRNFWRCCL